MSKGKAVLDQSHDMEEQSKALDQATKRAEAAEAEVARLKANEPTNKTGATKGLQATSEAGAKTAIAGSEIDSDNGDDGMHADAKAAKAGPGGVDEMRKDTMMVHLLDSLEAGKDIGHYGRLVFAMVARHFIAHDEVLRYLKLDKDFSEEQALLMLRQVESRGYNPPKRERILEWQSEQEFPILPNPDDPDCGNLYRNLKFPPEIYEHIEHYQEEKLQAGE